MNGAPDVWVGFDVWATRPPGVWVDLYVWATHPIRLVGWLKMLSL
jgi:hypothetical protein